MIRNYMGGNNENDRVASPESVPINLKVSFLAMLIYCNRKQINVGTSIPEQTEQTKIILKQQSDQAPKL